MGFQVPEGFPAEMCSGWLIIGIFFSGKNWAGVRTWTGLEMGKREAEGAGTEKQPHRGGGGKLSGKNNENVEFEENCSQVRPVRVP